MARIAVFDSGLGSLSVIKAIQKACKCEIIYFADSQNFPYGKKSKKELEQIIKKSIELIEEKFHPRLTVVGSNTPTLVLNIGSDKVVGVTPPLKEASKLSRTKNIAVLATSGTVKSRGLEKYITDSNLDKKTDVHGIDSSELVKLVESGKFLTDKSFCKNAIKRILQKIITEKNIDVCTLSSTHLPFLKPMLNSVFPKVQFIDPAEEIAEKIAEKIKSQSKRNSLKIYASGDTYHFKKNLERLGIKNKVNFLSL